MKKIVVLVLVLIIGMNMVIAQEKMTAKENLRYLIGSWVTEYEYPSYGTMREEATYTWGEDKNTVSIDFKVFSNDKQIDNGKGWIKYDPEKNIIFTSVSSEIEGATYASHEIKRDGNVSWMEGEGGATMPKFRIKITVIDENQYTWDMFAPQGDEWNEILSVTYNRKID